MTNDETREWRLVHNAQDVRQFHDEFFNTVLRFCKNHVYRYPPSYPALACVEVQERQLHVEYTELTVTASKPTQDSFNRHTLALLHAIITVLIHKGLVSPEQLEKLLLRATSDVDQWTAEDRDQPHKGVRHVFDGFYPPN